MIQIAESQTIAQKLDEVRQRATDLQNLIAKLDVEIETHRGQFGRAMALGNKESTLKSIRRELRPPFNVK